MNRLLISIAFGLAALGQTVAPDSAEQQAILRRMREAALSYSDRLQDFICTQITTRTADRYGNGHWKPLEVQELELSYVAHKESYRLLKVDGKSTDVDKRVKQGYFKPSGEFGTALRWIFGPKAKAEFFWDRLEGAGTKRACIFRYSVAESSSTMMMHADLDVAPMGHRGFVQADCDTGMVLRIHIVTDPAFVKRHGQPVAVGTWLDVRYGWTTISSKEFLVPQEAEETGIFGPTLTRAKIEFRNYRKYESNSTIRFDESPAKPPEKQ